MRKIALLCIFLLIGTFVYLQAQPGRRGRGGGGNTNAGLERDWALVSFELQITGEQYNNLRGTFQTAYNTRRDIMKQISAAGRDTQKTTKLMEEITQVQSNLEKRYSSLLTPNQLKRFTELRSSGRGGGRGRR